MRTECSWGWQEGYRMREKWDWEGLKCVDLVHLVRWFKPRQLASSISFPSNALICITISISRSVCRSLFRFSTSRVRFESRCICRMCRNRRICRMSGNRCICGMCPTRCICCIYRICRICRIYRIFSLDRFCHICISRQTSARCARRLAVTSDHPSVRLHRNMDRQKKLCLLSLW